MVTQVGGGGGEEEGAHQGRLGRGATAQSTGWPLGLALSLVTLGALILMTD